MAKRFELLVFDWDGTILDSTRAIVTSMQAACRDLGLPPPSDERARQVIGLGLGEALQVAAPDLDEASYPQMAERYRHHYLSSDQDLSLFAGIPELLAELQAAGFCLAVATGKSRRGLNRALAHSGLGEFFTASRCADECFSKPHPQMLFELMDELLFPPEQALMIGDTTHDLQMAKNAGIAGLGVNYGAHTPAQLSTLSPLVLVNNVAELSAWLHENA